MSARSSIILIFSCLFVSGVQPGARDQQRVVLMLLRPRYGNFATLKFSSGIVNFAPRKRVTLSNHFLTIYYCD
jgi:hypothetical protein